MFKLSLLIFILFHISLKAQVITDSLLIEGHYRTFNFSDPGNSKRSSLMFVMHGSGGNGKDMMQSAMKLEEKAKTEQLLVVYPDGYRRYWNECRKAATSKANIENI